MNDAVPEPGTVKEQIILPDGRYLIYYTFAEVNDNGDGPSAAESRNA
ncbi:MAG: hypothetical protein JO083_02475 [Candidatus Eremiobacteraeota bacterium]|nr:hypothetical protein [Candidatus Eremiobacteraeota bacterium]